MTDFNHPTGSSGDMLIRITGSTLQYFINSNNSTTFDNDLHWSYTINGVTSGTQTARYNAGAGWLLLGTWTVNYSQTVTFNLQATGTGGFGGPTSFSQAITVAAARINVGGVWKLATPWINVAGVWKQAHVWVNSAGTWKTAG